MLMRWQVPPGNHHSQVITKGLCGCALAHDPFLPSIKWDDSWRMPQTVLLLVGAQQAQMSFSWMHLPSWPGFWGWDSRHTLHTSWGWVWSRIQGLHDFSGQSREPTLPKKGMMPWDVRRGCGPRCLWEQVHDLGAVPFLETTGGGCSRAMGSGPVSINEGCA